MAVRPIDGNVLIEWFRPYLHTGEAIPADVVIEDIRSMPTITPPNEPLTLEVLAASQLLKLLGKKVEVIRMGAMCQAEWATVRSFGNCKTDSGCLCCHDLYGKTWIAYRRPPEGEEET